MKRKRRERKTVTIHGRRWKLERPTRVSKGYAGMCDINLRKIQIRKGLNEWQFLVVLIHECLHAADWNQSEEWVTQTAYDLAGAIWDSEYKREK